MNFISSNILCQISTVRDGNMSFKGGDEEEVTSNRRTFLKKHGIEYSDCCAMTCNHGEAITLVTRSNQRPVQSEVLVTQQKNLALLLLTADCQPMSFYDPITQTIALAHVSRKTLVDGLIKKTISFLHEELGVESKNLHVSIGPSIKKESYVFPLPLQEEQPELQDFIKRTDGFAYIDLIGASMQQLKKAGIETEQILVSEIDTGSSSQYYSYYRMNKNNEKNTARMATVLMLR